MTSPLVKLFVKDYRNTGAPEVRRRYGTLSGVVGIVANAVLFGVKLFAAIVSGAVSVLADALNNLSDAGSSVVTLVGFRMAGKPADREHPFGHGRIEYVAGFVVAVAILVMGVELVISSVEKLITPADPEFSTFTIAILGACVLVKLWMAWFNDRLGRKIASPVVRTAAKDSISDCVATTAVLAGALIGRYANVYIDPYIGMIVAGFILFTGTVAAKDCLSPLLGEKPSKALVEEIRSEVCKQPGVIGIHDLIVHDYGPGRKFASLHAEIPADADFVETHDAIDRIERAIQEKYECETTIHMDPIDLDDAFTVEMTACVREIAKKLGDDVNVHDVRAVRGPTHTNIVFDCVVPFKFRYSDREVGAFFEEAFKKIDDNYFVVVHVERNYSEA